MLAGTPGNALESLDSSKAMNPRDLRTWPRWLWVTYLYLCAMHGVAWGFIIFHAVGGT
jgi:hypothetical protein